MKKRGFTLVELLVVIAILAILATVSIVGYTSYIRNAKQQRADTEAAQIKKAIEGALIVDEELYLGNFEEKECYFSQKGLRIDGLTVTEETVLTSLAGDLAHLKGTLISYPNGYFRWITEDGAFSIFKVEIEGISVETEYSDLREYLENYFKTNSECLIGTYLGRKVYINSDWNVFIEQYVAMSHVPGNVFDVDTDINPAVKAITPQVTVYRLSHLVILQSSSESVMSSQLNVSRYGYEAFLSYKDENKEDRIVAKNNICREILARWWNLIGNQSTAKLGKASDDSGEIYQYVAVIDSESGKYSLARDLGNGEYKTLEAGAYIHLDNKNSTDLIANIYIGVEDDGRAYIYAENGPYSERIYLDQVFAR